MMLRVAITDTHVLRWRLSLVFCNHLLFMLLRAAAVYLMAAEQARLAVWR